MLGKRHWFIDFNYYWAPSEYIFPIQSNQAFQTKVKERTARAGKHDDLVIAAALAVWEKQRTAGRGRLTQYAQANRPCALATSDGGGCERKFQSCNLVLPESPLVMLVSPTGTPYWTTLELLLDMSLKNNAITVSSD